MATERLCSIEGCGKKHFTRGWCGAHYYKWKKHGDPLGGRRGASPGAPLKWINGNADYTGDDCLTWPFEIGRYGYGTIKHDGKRRVASRVMCEVAHGKPSNEALQAAHSCGNGHLGCMNPRHLRWATKRQNIEDMKLHGTFGAAQMKKATVLNPEKVRAIRSMAGQMTQKGIARAIGVSACVVGKVVRGESWTWVD